MPHPVALGTAALAVAAMLALLAPVASAQVPPPPEIAAGVLQADHVIDGRLDEADWEAAVAVDAFTQSDPREGEVASGRTTVRVLAGAKALVIGIVCEQPEGVGQVSFSVRRDAPPTQEDHVRVVLG